ncbi:MAG TPA: hypothetical protein DIT07_11630 [Sphingobacteriaceae bacterium]|nr:hypothetical protein [Sphingobacteriaceae bacterium]
MKLRSKWSFEYSAITGQIILISHQVTALKASNESTAIITALSAPGSIGAEVISICRDKSGK